MLKKHQDGAENEIGDAFLPAKKAVQSLHDRLSEQHPKEYAGADAACRELGNAGEPGRGEAGKRYGHGAAVHPKGLDYLINNGERVVRVLGGMAAAFVGMKFAPAAEAIFSGGKGGLAGPIQERPECGRGGRRGFFSAFRGASGSNGFRTTLGAAISSLIGGNGIKGTTGLLSAAAGTPGLLSGYQSAGSVLRGQSETARPRNGWAVSAPPSEISAGCSPIAGPDNSWAALWERRAVRWVS